jgi:hypothetical protein
MRLIRPRDRSRSLRVAGQSLDEAIQRVIARDGYETLLPAALLVMVAFWEWIRWYDPTPRPLPVTGVAVGAVCWAAYRLWKGRQAVGRFRLGRDGERRVAEELEKLRQRGFRVFHDIQGDGFNVDHLLVGPQGVFLIETKTRRKRVRGQVRIRYDGQAVTFPGDRPRRAAIRQATALASWIADLVHESSGRRCFVRPVVLIPDWYVDVTVEDPSVWVLNPKMLAGFIAREPSRLGPEDVELIAAQICRHVRAEARPRPSLGA